MSARMPSGWGFAPGADVAPVRDGNSHGNPRKVSQCARIAYWLGRIGYVPGIDEIQQRWHVGRAAAYRYRRFAEHDGETDLYPRGD